MEAAVKECIRDGLDPDRNIPSIGFPEFIFAYRGEGDGKVNSCWRNSNWWVSGEVKFLLVDKDSAALNPTYE
jgi:hypothetical protein